MPLALVVVRDTEGRVLLVHDAWKRYLELPGGVVEAGESFHQAATRELAEETGLRVGQHVSELQAAAVAWFRLGAERRDELASVHACRLIGAMPSFSRTDEVDHVLWWDPTSEHRVVSRWTWRSCGCWVRHPGARRGCPEARSRATGSRLLGQPYGLSLTDFRRQSRRRLSGSSPVTSCASLTGLESPCSVSLLVGGRPAGAVPSVVLDQRPSRRSCGARR